MTTLRALAAAFNRCARPLGVRLARANHDPEIDPNFSGNDFSEETLAQVAAKSGMSPREYVEARVYTYPKTLEKIAAARGQTMRELIEGLWSIRANAERFIEEMRKAGCSDQCHRVLEIGAGTGFFVEATIRHFSPQQYDVYEPVDYWASSLQRSFAPVVVRQPTDGRTLQPTPTESCGLVSAHGGFVIVRFLSEFEYLNEMIRVCAPGGVIAFDFFPAEAFDESAITKWLRTSTRYPAPIPSDSIEAFFSKRGCALVHQFQFGKMPVDARYLVFRKHR